MIKVENDIRVYISTQELHLFSGKKQRKIYPISTSKYGIGNATDSNKTPLGLHNISNKIGDDAAIGAIFKAGKDIGKQANINGDNADEDLITTRIMILTGLEEGINKGKNIDSYERGIWMHGTPEENMIGKPASHGCIRMKNEDICELFEFVKVGTQVRIIENINGGDMYQRSLDDRRQTDRREKEKLVDPEKRDGKRRSGEERRDS